MSSSLKLLCRCNDGSEAEAIRLRLDAAGIPSLITGVDSIHVGLEAGPKVEVAEEEFDRALQILVSDLQKTNQADPWQCRECSERNDAAFELCWKCQKPRDDADHRWIQLPPAPTVQAESKKTPADDSNPYRPVLLEDEQPPMNLRQPPKRFYPAITVTFAALLAYFLLAALIRWARM